MKKTKRGGNGATTKAATKKGRRCCSAKSERFTPEQRESEASLGSNKADRVGHNRQASLLPGKPRGLTVTGGVLGQLIPAARKRLAEIDAKIQSLTSEIDGFVNMRRELQQELDYMISVQEQIKPSLLQGSDIEADVVVLPD